MGAGLYQLHIFEGFEPFEHCLRFSLSSNNYLATVRGGASIQFVEQVEELGELFSVHNVNQLGAGYIGKPFRMATSEEISFHFLVAVTLQVACKREMIAFHAETIFGDIAALVEGYTVSFAELSGQLKIEVLLNPLTVVSVLGNLTF